MGKAATFDENQTSVSQEKESYVTVATHGICSFLEFIIESQVDFRMELEIIFQS